MRSSLDPRAVKVTFGGDSLTVHVADGRRLTVPLAYFPRLAAATQAQLRRCTISGGGVGLHWDALDEDILVANLFLGVGDRSREHGRTGRRAGRAA